MLSTGDHETCYVIAMSSSQHPIALKLERLFGLRETVSGPTKLLAIVMFLPLIDGIFPALILAGGIDSVAGILQVGLLVFGGSAVLAVILAEMDGTPREQAKIVLLVAAGLLPLAAVEAALAPTIASVLDLAIFERFAALVIAAVGCALIELIHQVHRRHVARVLAAAGA